MTRIREFIVWFWVVCLVLPLRDFLIHRIARRRSPDITIGGHDNPYLRRWYLTPWSAWFRAGQRRWWQRAIKALLPNVYLHQVLRSDDDRALHDHPWFNCSLILANGYLEHTIAAGGIEHRHARVVGDLKIRGPRAAHRLELTGGPCWTLFLTGPVWRDWGFHCPQAGWRHWRDFTNPGDGGATVGRGCAE